MSEFILKNIEITLDPSSIDKAIETVEKLKSDLGSALKRICETLAEQGVEFARANIVVLGAVTTGALMNSVAYHREGEVWYVTAGDKSTEIESREGYSVTNYAVFVEYGTGLVSARDMHPTYIVKDNSARTFGNQRMHYNLNKHYFLSQKNHGAKGWVYKTGVPGDKSSGHFYTTAGRPARPFMYNTMKDLQREAELNGGRLIAQYIP